MMEKEAVVEASYLVILKRAMKLTSHRCRLIVIDSKKKEPHTTLTARVYLLTYLFLFCSFAGRAHALIVIGLF